MGQSTMLKALTATRCVSRALASRHIAPRAFSTKFPDQPDAFAAGELQSDLDQANGLRREEIEAELTGQNRFEGEWSGPPGTKDSPIIVESIADNRIVGIPSRDDHGEEGEVKWFQLKASDGAVEHHGQWFKLKQVEHHVAEGYERHH